MTTIKLSSPFISDLVYTSFTRADGEVMIQLEAPLKARTRKGEIIAPTGFVSDGASIPRFAFKVIGHPFDLEYLPAAIIHDLLYRKHNGYFALSRKDADVIFKDLMWNSKTPKWKIPLMYAAVRSCGAGSYKVTNLKDEH